MVAKPSSSNVHAPNSGREPISDDDLIRGFVLALGAGGRKTRTLFISIRSLSELRPKSWSIQPGRHGPHPHPPLAYLTPPEGQQTRYCLHSLQELESLLWLVCS